MGQFIKLTNQFYKSMYQLIKTSNRFNKSVDWFVMSSLWFKSSKYASVSYISSNRQLREAVQLCSLNRQFRFKNCVWPLFFPSVWKNQWKYISLDRRYFHCIFTMQCCQSVRLKIRQEYGRQIHTEQQNFIILRK